MTTPPLPDRLPARMKAFRLEAYGGPEAATMADLPLPQPSPSHLLVRVHAAGLNPVDYKIRDGKLKALLGRRPPFVLGNELSGIVVDGGSGRFPPGSRIAARVPNWELGCLADYALVDERCAASLPDTVDMTQAAGLPLAGQTALQALRRLPSTPGANILILGGAGGVGTFAIQIARMQGARCTTTASRAGRELVLALGADEVIDYAAPRPFPLVSFDGMLDLVGAEQIGAFFPTFKPGAPVVSVAGPPEPRTATEDLGLGFIHRLVFAQLSYSLRLRLAHGGHDYRMLFMRPNGADLALLVDLLKKGRLRVEIDGFFPGDRIPDAFASLETGHCKGKVIIRWH